MRSLSDLFHSSERELRQRRKLKPELSDDLFVGIDDALFRTIEEKLSTNVRQHFGLSVDTIIYDTTNFFTYIEEPVRTELARTGHNKDFRHHLKQVGLAMCVDKEWGIPLFHRLYRGNSHDSKTFSGLVDNLITKIRVGFEQVEKLVLVMDKGNNSQDNFKTLEGNLKWVGSLVPSHFVDLMEIALDSYGGKWKDYQYLRLSRDVMGINSALVLTYNSNLARKQELSLEHGIAKLKQLVEAKWKEYKRVPKRVPATIDRIIKESHYGKYIKVSCQNGRPTFEQTDAFVEKRKLFGKNLLFSDDLNTSSPSLLIIVLDI